MVAVQYTSPETMSFAHSIRLVAAMVIGGAGSIVGSLLGGAYYVLAPQFTNTIDSSLTLVLQGIILLAVLFVLPGGLVSLPRLWRRRKGDDRGTPAGGAAASRSPPRRSHPSHGPVDPPEPNPSTQSPEKRQDT